MLHIPGRGQTTASHINTHIDSTLMKLSTLGEQPSLHREGAAHSIKGQPTLAIFLAICSPLMAGMSGAVEACKCEGRPNAEDYSMSGVMSA